MKLYLQVINGKIVALDTEKNDKYNDVIEVVNIDEFYNLVKSLGELEESADEQARAILEDVGEEKSISTYNIKHWVSNRSFGELIDMYESGEIKKPDMQREFVWDSQKSSRLIESIILGLPIPPLFLLEVSNNQYELIDGYQRVTTVTNFVQGRSWSGENSGKKNVKAKLSGNISKELVGKTFEKLDPEYQRTIKRSTIPLIEFRQIGPEDLSSKYLIFERINTGSEKLNQMQIRKALAHGPFISSVYKQANSCEKLKKLFSTAAIKKDSHVEAYLRIYAMTEIFYRKYMFDKSGLNNILNVFCESYRAEEIPEMFQGKLERALTLMERVFEDTANMFKRVELNDAGKYEYVGSRNISIMEAMLGVSIEHGLTVENTDIDKVRKNYKVIIAEIVKKAIEGKEDNPFSTSTGTKPAIEKRFFYAEKILE